MIDIPEQYLEIKRESTGKLILNSHQDIYDLCQKVLEKCISQEKLLKPEINNADKTAVSYDLYDFYFQENLKEILIKKIISVRNNKEWRTKRSEYYHIRSCNNSIEIKNISNRKVSVALNNRLYYPSLIILYLNGIIKPKPDDDINNDIFIFHNNKKETVIGIIRPGSSKTIFNKNISLLKLDELMKADYILFSKCDDLLNLLNGVTADKKILKRILSNLASKSDLYSFKIILEEIYEDFEYYFLFYQTLVENHNAILKQRKLKIIERVFKRIYLPFLDNKKYKSLIEKKIKILKLNYKEKD